MIKKLFFIILVTSLCIYGNAQKSNTCQEQAWVDSVFNVNFSRMQLAVDSSKMYDNYVDRGFVYFLSYISGIECTTIDYSGFCYFNKERLEEWRKWYESNKHQIYKEKVEWGLSVLHSENITQQQLDSLHRLKVLPKKE